jgi:hypothetical protein
MKWKDDPERLEGKDLKGRGLSVSEVYYTMMRMGRLTRWRFELNTSQDRHRYINPLSSLLLLLLLLLLFAFSASAGFEIQDTGRSQAY